MPTGEVAVLLPCYNEEASIGQTVREFRSALPAATIYVYDNNSSDQTSARAAEAGAIVRRETYQGKGNVVRRMFADIEADVYVLADGDATYDAEAAPELLDRLTSADLDMVNGVRVSGEQAAYRRGHRFGNWLLTRTVQTIFGRGFDDLLSGYRVMSRRFVKSFPAASKAFEIETELSVHVLQMRFPFEEVETVYRSRPEGSVSKLSTFQDGARILKMIGILAKEEKPIVFFAILSLVFFAPAFILFLSILSEYFATGEVPRFPSLIAAIGGFVVAALTTTCGLILDSLSRARMEIRRFAYVQASRHAQPREDAAVASGGVRRERVEAESEAR